jgi:hypothetical protein
MEVSELQPRLQPELGLVVATKSFEGSVLVLCFAGLVGRPSGGRTAGAVHIEKTSRFSESLATMF